MHLKTLLPIGFVVVAFTSIGRAGPPVKNIDSSGAIVTLFADGKNVASRQVFPDDPIFDRYLSLSELGMAWHNADAGGLADISIEASEAERILLRCRKGLPTGAIWYAAAYVASVKHDELTVARLVKAAQVFNPQRSEPRLAAVLKLASQSEGVPVGLSVDKMPGPSGVSADPEELKAMVSLSQRLSDAQARGDDAYRRDIEHNLPVLFPRSEPRPKLVDQTLSRSKSDAGDAVLPADIKNLFNAIAFEALGLSSRRQSHLVDRLGSASRLGGMLGGWVDDAKDEGGHLSDVAKGTGGQISDSAKQAGGQISEGAKNVGKAASDAVKHTEDEAAHLADESRREGKNFRELMQREWVNGRKEVGRPWNRGIRDPWVHALARWYGMGQARLDDAQKQFDLTRSKIQMPLEGKDCCYIELSGGSYQGQQFKGNISAPSGGIVGYPVIYYYYYWGQTVELITRFKVNRGTARFVVKRIDGTTVASSAWRSASYFGHEVLQLQLPEINSTNSFQTPDGFGGHYLVGLECGSNSSATLWYLTYGDAGNVTDPDSYFYSLAQRLIQGSWFANGLTINIEPSGQLVIQTPAGTGSFQYVYDPSSGQIRGADSQGHRETAIIQLVDANSMDWINRTGRRHFVKKTN